MVVVHVEDCSEDFLPTLAIFRHVEAAFYFACTSQVLYCIRIGIGIGPQQSYAMKNQLGHPKPPTLLVPHIKVPIKVHGSQLSLVDVPRSGRCREPWVVVSVA